MELAKWGKIPSKKLYLGGKFGFLSGFLTGVQIGLIYGFLSGISEVIMNVWLPTLDNVWDIITILLVMPVPFVLLGAVIGIIVGTCLGLILSLWFDENQEKNTPKVPIIIGISRLICIAYPIFYVIADWLLGSGLSVSDGLFFRNDSRRKKQSDHYLQMSHMWQY